MPGDDHLTQELGARQLRYLLALARVGSFRGAAALLAVPPGLLSREIAVLERTFGTPLFVRRPRAAVPTRAGMEVTELARRALDSRTARNDALAAPGVSLRVGWADFGRGQAIQRAALAEFRAQYPRVPVRLEATPYRDQLRDLENGSLNAGFYCGTLPRTPGLASEVLLPDTVGSALLPAGHRLASHEVVALTEMNGFPLHSMRMDYAPDIMDGLCDGVSRGGWRGRQTAGSELASGIITTIASGAAWAPALSGLAGWMPPGVVLIPLADGPLLAIDLHLLWRHDDPVAIAFAGLAFELRDALDAAMPRPMPSVGAMQSTSGLMPARTHAERARAERTLGDELLQDIVGSELELEALRRRLPAALAGEGDGLEAVMERLRRAARMGREVLENGAPAAQPKRDLALALALAMEPLREGSAAQFRIAAEGDPTELRPLAEEAALGIAAEGVANALRHADASHVSVTLEFRDDLFRLRVADDGKGIPAGVLADDSFRGLSLMREHAAGAGGTLALRSAPGAGSVVELVVPAALAFAGGGGSRHCGTGDAPGVRSATGARPSRAGG